MSGKVGGRNSRQWMIWAFKLQGCRDCGRRYPDYDLSDLHCHHRDPSQKQTGTRSGLDLDTGGVRSYNSQTATFAELAKCDVLCEDCHKKRHRLEQIASSFEQPALFAGTGEAWRINGH